jgi:hypothetical protein
MAYCTADEVNEILGGSLSPEAEDAAVGVVEGVSAFIDVYTGQSFGAAGLVADEVQTVRTGQVRLSRPPVTAVSAVSVTEPYIGAVPVPLVDGQSYQLIDASSGLLLVAACDGAVATISYTAAAASVPAHINLAAKILSAHCIRYAIDPTGFTLSQLQAGTATLTYLGNGGAGGGAGPGAGLPALFEALLGGGTAGGAGQPWVFA